MKLLCENGAVYGRVDATGQEIRDKSTEVLAAVSERWQGKSARGERSYSTERYQSLFRRAAETSSSPIHQTPRVPCLLLGRVASGCHARDCHATG